jgi:hypothetical protein
VHIEFLLEEPSAEMALQYLLSKLLSTTISYKLHSFNGKQNLLKELPKRLIAYSKWMPDYYRIVVLLDSDGRDCIEVKRDLESVASNAGLITKSMAVSPTKFQVVNRIAIEELEVWFLGDMPAINKAFPKIPAHVSAKAKYRNPDLITGGTAEALEKLLKSRGYYRAGMPKIDVARKIAPHMQPRQNTSPSFRMFCSALESIGN